MIEESTIQHIIECWAADQAHQGHDRVQRPLPNLHDVREVIETSFFASIKREETRLSYFSVVLASPDDLSEQPHRYHYELQRFGTPLPFTVESICKLAPAFDLNRSAIAVGRTNGNNELTCWGVFFFAPRSHVYNEIPVGTEGGTCSRPDLFTVTVIAPGALKISRMNAHIGRFLNGEFVPASPTPFATAALGQHLLHALEQTELWQKYQTIFWSFYGAALNVLLFEAALRGHGATVVLLPNANAGSCQEHIVEKYRFENSISLKNRFEKAINRSEDILPNIAYRKDILEHIQVLAQLSAADGALILSAELDLISFGATLNAPKWEGKTILGPDAFGFTNENPFSAKRFGTRHNSAIDFAGACSGCIVFVISEDGPIRAFTKSGEDTVLCWPDCSESMFVELIHRVN
jgi:hypothetical protein